MTENNYAILDNIPNGICIIDSHFMVQYFNPCLETWTGMRSSEIIGKDLRKMFPVFSEIRFSGRIESVLKNGQPVLFSSLLNAPFFNRSDSGGVLRRQQITVVAASGSVQEGARAMLAVRDDTEMIHRIELLEKAQQKAARELKARMKYEKQLKESEKKLRSIVENSTNLFYSHSEGHDITYISPQARAFLQCEPEEAKVKWTEFATDHPVNEKGFELTEKAIRTGEKQPSYELELMGVKGKKIWVEVRETPVVKNGKTVSIVGSLTDITESRKARQVLQRNLKEKETLLKEVHHRVKNNLQVITSLLRMQSNQTASEKTGQALAEALNRIRAIASVHEQLYKSENLATVPAREYFSRLFNNLISVARSEGRQIDLQLHIEDIKLNPDNAVSFGLIANELMTNALKYAFVDSNSPQNVIIAELHKVTKREEGPFVQFSFSDNGRGLPDDFDLNKQDSLGMKLISGLTEQLEGTLELLENDGGVGFMIEFPLKQEQPASDSRRRQK